MFISFEKYAGVPLTQSLTSFLIGDWTLRSPFVVAHDASPLLASTSPMSGMGHFRPIPPIRAMSALPPKATEIATCRAVAKFQ
jgi:hypothetical protein